MGKFDGMLICTDLDGTLLRNDKTVSKADKEAIEYFKREGGYFTFVTGRMPFSSTYARDVIEPNAPFGCVNGAGLYDADAGKYLWTAVMPECVVELAAYIDALFPEAGIQINSFYKSYYCKENNTMAHFRKITQLENTTCHYREVPEPIAKVLFGSDCDETIRQIALALQNHPLAENFAFIRSEKTLYEVLPRGITKGTSIAKLCDLLQLDVRNTIAIGDYNNDIPMFEAAGVGIAVSNACEDALRAADYITVSNEEDAVAHVIYDIEAGKYSK